MEPNFKTKDSIVFYDGHCGLCDRFIQFILKRDSARNLNFTAIQSIPGKNLLRSLGVREEEIEQLSTVYFLNQGVLYRHSEAVFKILRELPPPWKLLSAGKYLPPSLSDLLYRGIAQSRYRWFGSRSSCRVPEPQDRYRFIEESNLYDKTEK